MKKIITGFIFILFCFTLSAQSKTNDATIVYSLSVKGSGSQEAATVFNGATLTVYVRGKQALQELKSSVLNQSIIYNGDDASAVILKQAGDQKFIINLDADNWKHYNRRYEGIAFTYTDETKTIDKYICKKAIAKLSDGTELVVYYAPDLNTSARGYDYQFKDLKGMPLEYEVQNGQTKVTYTAISISTFPVPAFKFDVPKTGYRILDYKSS